MIVSCSNCDKRYVVDPRALGTPGRRVRCAHCQHTWFQAAPEDAQAQPQIEAPPLPETPPLVRSTATEAPRHIQLPAIARGTGRAKWVGRAAIAAVVVLVVWGLVRSRDSVMSAVPFTGRLYSLVGLGPVAPGTGLDLRQVTPTRGTDKANGAPTLAIDGQVANISTITRPVPQLRVALRDVNNAELKSWLVHVTDQPLAPGASIPFHTMIQDPPDGATGVIVSFGPG